MGKQKKLSELKNLKRKIEEKLELLDPGSCEYRKTKKKLDIVLEQIKESRSNLG